MNLPPTPSISAGGEPPARDPLAELFPGPAHLGRRRRLERRVVAGGAAAALLLVGAAAVAGADDAGSRGHRTAEVAERDVAQVIDGVASVEPVSQASVAFPVSGTVSSVHVKAGDEIVVGQVLADLDTASLTRTLHERQAALASAELVLQKALDGEDVSGLTGGRGPSGSSATSPTGISWDTTASTGTVQTVALEEADVATATSTTTTTTSAPTAGPPASTAPSGSTGSAAGSADAELRAAQQAVLDAQAAVDAALAEAEAALDAATRVCADVTGGGDTTTTTSTTTPDRAAAAADPSSEGDADAIAACREALAAVRRAQAEVAARQSALADASRTLDALIAARAGSTGSGSTGSGSTGSTSDPSSSGSSGVPSDGTTTGSTPSAGSGATTTTASPSSEQLIAYQKAVDAAAAEVTVAEQALDQATIVSPIAGTVAAVGLAAGDDVTAGSATATVVVVGSGGYEVTTTVTVDEVADIEVGQAATVVPDGDDASFDGEVVAIGAPDSSSGSTTYPVTIGLTGDTTGLGNGSTAAVSIVTDSATRALAVPASAVTFDGDTHQVTVVEDGKAKTVTVEVGAIGRRWIEITDGLEAGDAVSLADLDQELPSSATEATSGSGGGGSTRFPGGGDGPPAGFNPPSGGGFPGAPPGGN